MTGRRYYARPDEDGGYGVWDTHRSGFIKDGNGQYRGMHPNDAVALANDAEAGEWLPGIVTEEDV